MATDAALGTPLNRAADKTGFTFGTKGETLANLARQLQLARLCEQMVVDTGIWHKHPESVVADVLKRFPATRLAVRSCASHEDGHTASHAGRYESVVGIESTRDHIADAIERVVDSYEELNDNDQVLIQPLVEDVVISGVVLTRDLDRGSPYYVINYDDFTGRTDTVTSGGESKEIWVHHDRPHKLRSPRFAGLVAAVREIEEITNSDTLDIEFCITKDSEIFILQVRPLAAAQKWKRVEDDAIADALAEAESLVTAGMQSDAVLSGSTTQYSEMADWNPAEMIGSTPRPLALSLYRHLITDAIWIRARRHMQYRQFPDRPLLVSLHGRPYIDVRLSLNSFLPHDLDNGLAHRLIDYQLSSLAQRRELHDKIEFDISITCLDFNFAEHARELHRAGFSEDDLKALESSLRALTVHAIRNFPDGLQALITTALTLLENDPAQEDSPPLQRAKHRLSACMERGTLPFAILARHAFIATALLRSLVSCGAMTEREMEVFTQNVHTITVDFVEDMYAASHGRMPMSEFFRRYGHLRPGTYDIQSHRYDERPDLFVGQKSVEPRKNEPFELSSKSRNAIEKALGKLDRSISVEQLFGYIAVSIAARENAKFAFTRPLSDALTDITAWGSGYGLSREDLSFLAIDQIFSERDEKMLRADIEQSRARYAVTRSIALPHLIVDSYDVDVVRFPLGKPNFITGQKLVAPVLVLDQGDDSEIDGHIVFIERADPGFDWIFSRSIKGLVTKHGGANSHMAIRCAEFGLPAAIGCGARLYDILAVTRSIELDCAAKTIRAVS